VKPQVVRTFSRWPRLGSLGVVLPCLTLPLCIVAAAAVPTFEFFRVDALVEGASARSRRAQHLERFLASPAQAVDPSQVAEVTAALRALIPERLEPLAVHSDARRLARELGLRLTQVRVGNSRDLGLRAGADTVLGTAHNLSGAASPLVLETLVRGLRRSGHPLAVRALHLWRGAEGSAAELEFELQLELFTRGAPPTDPAPAESGAQP
jgi:hypothetical protein